MSFEPVGWEAPRRSLATRWLPSMAVIAGVIALAVIATLQASPEVCACTPTPELRASPVEGVIVAVDSAGLGQVKGFTLRLGDGSTMSLTLGSVENAAGFPPSHLVEHQASSEPVRAYYRLEGDVPVVYRLEDAPR